MFLKDSNHFRGDSFNEMYFLFKTKKYLKELNIFITYLYYIVLLNVVLKSSSEKSSTVQEETISLITSIEGR